MATPHVIGSDIVVKYDDKKHTLAITVSNVEDLVETAKMKLGVSTSGFVELPFTLEGITAKLNLQFGINKPKSEHWPS